MFKKLGFCLGGLLLSTASAHAGMILDVIVQQDLIDWMGPNSSITRTHDLTTDVAEGDVFVVGGSRSITSGKFSLEYRDDSAVDDSTKRNLVEWVFDIPVPSSGGVFFDIGVSGDVSQALVPNVVAYLNANGVIDVEISSVFGDFYVDTTSLMVYTDDKFVSVPEPSVLILLGVGLVGLRVARPYKA